MTKEKLVPMTTEEEDKNADVVRDSNGNVMPEKLLKDDRGDLDLTKIIDLQTKEIRDLVHDNTILLTEVKKLVKKINELNSKNETQQ
jgi:hypothetical protein|tara:strand:+ start:108 stop:368 length:261 start_codon:yes stop_codon:yes gene_type:complete